MSQVTRVLLPAEVSDLVDQAHGTQEAFQALSALAGDEQSISQVEALEKLKQVAASLPRETCECDMLGRRRCGKCG